MRAPSGLGNLEDVQRWSLVVRRTDRARGRRRWWLVAPVALVVAVAAGVVSTDPVGYGVAFWPFLSRSDRDDLRVMEAVAGVARAEGDPARVPPAVAADGIEVLETHLHPPNGAVWMRVRYPVHDGVRCREVMVLGDRVQVTSRRVDC